MKRRTIVGNRRLGPPRRKHLLDVKVRAATARRQRRQFFGGIFWRLALVVVLCAAGWLGIGTALDKFFFANPEYTLRRITTELDGVMTREEALHEAGIREGDNIFRIDLAAASRALREVPQVETVVIERHLPDTLSVTLTARRAVAWVAPPDRNADPFDPERGLLVDANGFLMRPRLVQPEYFHLPVIYGVQSENIRDGEPLPNEDLRRALLLIAAVERTPGTPWRIRSMDIAKGYCFEVTSDRNALITFAPEDFESQLARLARLLEYCTETGRELETVNLMVRRNTPVTFVLAQAPTPPKPKKN